MGESLRSPDTPAVLVKLLRQPIEDLVAQNLEVSNFPRERLRLDGARLTLFVFRRSFPHVDHRLVCCGRSVWDTSEGCCGAARSFFAMLNLNPHVGCCPLRPHADRACARFAGTHWYPLGAQKSGIGDRQDDRDRCSCPMKTGPAPDFALWLTTPDKREVGSSTLPRPINQKLLPLPWTCP
jgi:hypothetical protein